MTKINNLISKLKLGFTKNKTKPAVSKETHTSGSVITKFISKYSIPPEFAISGVCVIVSIIIYFVLLSPLRAENRELKSDLNSKAEKLERYSRKGKNIYSEKRIKSKEQSITLIENELNMCKEIMLDRDMMIEKVFVDINGEQIKDEALCKDYYNRKCNDLLGFCKRNGFNITRDSIGFKNWNSKLPTLDEIAVEQKKLLIQSDIIKIVVKNRSFIRGFDNLTFEDSLLLKNDLPSNLVTPIQFSLKLQIEYPKILYFISDILNSGLNIFIGLVNIETDNNTTYQPDKLIDATYTVTLHAYAMDFKNET
ncbi:MAG: hypothetical protein ACUZ8O_14870 [Candidatus Anammoxibacter sp.]